MTIVELLAALALLSGLLVAAASWTRIAGTMSRDCSSSLHWRHSAEAVLELIHDDLASGDFLEEAHVSEPRIAVTYDALTIQTRTPGFPGIPGTPGTPGTAGNGPVEHVFEFDSFSHRLTLVERTAIDSTERLLLGDVAEIEWSMPEEAVHLDVLIRSLDGVEAARRFPL